MKRELLFSKNFLWSLFVSVLLSSVLYSCLFGARHEPKLTMKQMGLAVDTRVELERFLDNQSNIAIEYYDSFRSTTKMNGQVLNDWDLAMYLKNNGWMEIPVSQENDVSLCRGIARMHVSAKVGSGESLYTFCKNAVLLQLSQKEDKGLKKFAISIMIPVPSIP